MPNVIRALTPLILAAIGGGTAVLILFLNSHSPKDDPNLARFAAGMAFASTTITAAAALAQPGKGSTSTETQLPPSAKEGEQ